MPRRETMHRGCCQQRGGSFDHLAGVAATGTTARARVARARGGFGIARLTARAWQSGVAGLGSGLLRLRWRWPWWVAALWKRDTSSAETFFSAGALLLIAGLGFAAAWLGARGPQPNIAANKSHPGRFGLARQHPASQTELGHHRPAGVWRVSDRGHRRVSVGCESDAGNALPARAVLRCSVKRRCRSRMILNSQAGRDFYGLNPAELAGVSVVSFRVRDGDDASCLNLNRAQKPRVLGVNPETSAAARGIHVCRGGEGIAGRQSRGCCSKASAQTSLAEDEIPAIGDRELNPLGAGQKSGRHRDYTDERGRAFKLRLVGAVANSILQGSLIIDEAEFVKRFPGESGYRMFLIDAPSNCVAKVFDHVDAGIARCGSGTDAGGGTVERL